MVELKKHNVEPYNRVSAMLEKENRVAYISCTGTGKTYVAAKYIEDKGLVDKTLVVCPTNVIKDEWKDVLPNVKVVTYAALKNIDTIADFQLVVTDELHHLMAEEWHKVFDRLTEGYRGKILGLTATNIRYLDGFKDVAEEYFNNCKVNGYTLDGAIEQGILPTFTYVSALYDFAGYKEQMLKKYKFSEKLRTKLDLYENKYEIKKIVGKHIKGNKILVFTDGLSVIDDVAKMIDEICPESKIFSLSSKVSNRQNKEAVKSFEEERDRCFLISVDMLNEGVHIDGVDTVIMLRRTKSAIVYLQQLGRALSTSNKKKPVIIDLVANHHNLVTYTKAQNNSINWLIEAIKDKKKQIIVKDYAMSELELLDQIKERYGIAGWTWTPEDEETLKNNMRMTSAELQQKFFPNRTLSAINQKRYKLFGSVFIQDRWTEQQLKVAEENWSMTPTELQKLLPDVDVRRLKYLLSIARRKMGKLKKVAKTHWTEEEQRIVQDNWAKKVVELGELLPNKTHKQIMGKLLMVRRDVRGKTREKSVPWADWEVQYIKDNCCMTARDMMKVLTGRTEQAIRIERSKLGLGRPVRKWTKHEEEYILANPDKSIEELSAELGVSRKAVRAKRGRLTGGWNWGRRKTKRG